MSHNDGNRIVCYCDDCQSFAYFLERADEILDAHGGTDIFQMSPARLEISQGADRLACMRLTEGGMLRWYASCCKTPIGNTLASHQVPFVGLIHSCVDHTADVGTRDEALGPIRARVMAGFSKGDRSELDAYDRRPVSMQLRMIRMLLMARLRGEHAHSPFFDATSGEPATEPRVLNPEELREIEAARDAIESC